MPPIDSKIIKPNHKQTVTDILNETVKVLDAARKDGIIVQYNINCDDKGNVTLTSLDMFQKL